MNSLKKKNSPKKEETVFYGAKITLGIAIFMTIFSILPILAPIFAHIGWNSGADVIYWIYQWFCHQRPWRSYHLFDYQLAMDSRMMLMYSSMATGAFVVYYKNIKPLPLKWSILFGLGLITPLGVDGVVQAVAEVLSLSNGIPFYESTNLTRSFTGAIFGTGIAFSVLPFLNGLPELKNNVNQIKKYSLQVFLGNLLLIPLLVGSWYLTSNKYLPNSIFIDHTRRIPGYNYEITESAGHSTIKRILRINEVNLYLKRADENGRQDLILEYQNKLTSQ